MRLLIVGPPGAGKGTQARRIAEQFGIPAISTGDIFRKNIADGTELGLKVDAIVKSGGYVSDEITNELVRDRLTWSDCGPGFLLDGYPRTAAQVAELDAMLAALGRPLDAVVELTVDDEAVVKRLLLRAGVEGRVDDTEDVVRHRMAVYHDQTAPLIKLYSERGVLVPVDGMGEIDDVTSRVISALEPPAA